MPGRTVSSASSVVGLSVGFTGILQADAFAGFNRLYAAARRPGPLVEAACWSHATLLPVSDWSEELSEWLKPFLARLGHKARRRMCPLYVAGLIGQRRTDGGAAGAGRLRLTPSLERVGDAAPLEEELARQADALVGGPDTVLVINDTSPPKVGWRRNTPPRSARRPTANLWFR